MARKILDPVTIRKCTELGVPIQSAAVDRERSVAKVEHFRCSLYTEKILPIFSYKSILSRYLMALQLPNTYDRDCIISVNKDLDVVVPVNVFNMIKVLGIVGADPTLHYLSGVTRDIILLLLKKYTTNEDLSFKELKKNVPLVSDNIKLLEACYTDVLELLNIKELD